MPGRPGGNPDIWKYHFKKKYDWSEPCDKLLSLKVPESMKLALKDGSFPGWQEAVRQVIAAGIEANTEDSRLRDRGAEG